MTIVSADIASSLAAATPGVIAGIGGILLAINARREIKAKGQADYVLLTRQATEIVTERMEEVRNDYNRARAELASARAEIAAALRDHARCERNIIRLSNAMTAAGLTVPALE